MSRSQGLGWDAVLDHATNHGPELNTMATVMMWCCPDSAPTFTNSYATRVFKGICSTNAVRAFLADPCGVGSIVLFDPRAQVMGLASAA